ncbi:hypothetical protein B0H14DRAFT_3461231 [Mycena olivaceomarginata]|nr:hypothetical protein B0H14DRAFT_3461231 [Mycena olivaceomarginata]
MRRPLCPLSPTSTTASCFVLTHTKIQIRSGPPRHTTRIVPKLFWKQQQLTADRRSSFTHSHFARTTPRRLSTLTATSKLLGQMQTSATSSGHLIVGPPSLKRRPMHERLKRYYTFNLPLFVLHSPQEGRLAA